MNIINGVKDFEEMLKCKDASTMIEFWDTLYYPKYKNILDHQLTYLYHADKSVFHQFIKDIDKDNALETIRIYNDSVIVSDIIGIVKSVADDLKFNEEFDVYTMMGFGHVAGTSGHGECPFVYYGVESFLQNRIDINYIVPHEMNHMVRINALGNYRSDLGTDGLSFGDVMILEGLGAAYPVVFLNGNDRFDNDKFYKSLMIPKNVYEILANNEQKLTKRLLNIANEKISVDDWQKYFMINAASNSEEHPTAMGYYVGGKLIFKLLEKGFTILELTCMDTDKMLLIVNSKTIIL